MRWGVGVGVKVMLLPRWPTPAGRVQWDVPWLQSDTFIITKNNNSGQQKKKTKQKADRRGSGEQTRLAKTC